MQAVRRAAGDKRKAGSRPLYASMAARFRVPSREGCPGTFSQSKSSLTAEIPCKASLFVCFECDPLSEELRERNFFARTERFIAGICQTSPACGPASARPMIGQKLSESSFVES